MQTFPPFYTMKNFRSNTDLFFFLHANAVTGKEPSSLSPYAMKIELRKEQKYPNYKMNKLFILIWPLFQD